MVVCSLCRLSRRLPLVATEGRRSLSSSGSSGTPGMSGLELSCFWTYSFKTRCPGAPGCLGTLGSSSEEQFKSLRPRALPSEAKVFASELKAVRLSEEKACSDTKAPLGPEESGLRGDSALEIGLLVLERLECVDI